MDYASENEKHIHTGGGANVGGNVEVGRDFVGHDKIVYGDEINLTLGTAIEVPAPPDPRYLPDTAGFVGREQELAYYSNKLATTGLATIIGMPGVGKTWLAASLARRIAPADKIFWYRFHENKQAIDSIIWDLAGFMARHGQAELWQMLNKTQLTRGQPLPTVTLLNYMIQSIRGQGYVLFLDDFQYVDDDHVIDILAEYLLDLLSTGDLSLIITSRRLPKFVQSADSGSLSGLNEVDTRFLLNTRGVQLSDALFEKLYSQVEGNAQLLTMTIKALHGKADAERLINRLVETPDIERYLFDQVHDRLSKEERDIMKAVAALLGYQGTRQIIEWLLNEENLRRQLLKLCDQHLLVATRRGDEWEYGQHASYQAFFYEVLGAKERQDMHRRIGEYYNTTELDVIKAALHFERAAEYAKSAQLITDNVLALINLFQAPLLAHLLDRLDGRSLSSDQQLQIKLARGQVYVILGDKLRARSSYEMSITLLELLPDSREAAVLFARACHGLSMLLRFEDPKEAQSWLLKGLDRLEGKAAEEQKVALVIALGGVEASMGNFDKALKISEDGLGQIVQSPSQLRGEALSNLLLIHFARGDLKAALRYSDLVLANAQALNNTLHEQIVLGNSALIKFTVGRWKDAIADLEKAVQLSKQLMDRQTQTALTTNLGIAYLKMGAYQEAKNNLNVALELAQSNQLRPLELVALCGLANLYVYLKEWQTAETSLQRAEELAKSLAEKAKEIVVYRIWAELRLATATYAEAAEYANRSIELARNLDMKHDQAIGLRVLGQILGASGSLQESEGVLKTSLSLLDDSDKYETARTQVELGQTLLQLGQIDYGRELIDKAHSTFDELGVQYEL